MAAPNIFAYSVATSVASAGIGSVGLVFWPWEKGGAANVAAKDTISARTSALTVDSPAVAPSEPSETIVKFLPCMALLSVIVIVLVIVNHLRKPSVKPSVKKTEGSSSSSQHCSSRRSLEIGSENGLHLPDDPAPIPAVEKQKSPTDMLKAINDDRAQWLQGLQATAESLFDEHDKDNSGTLETEEFKALLEALASHAVLEYDTRYTGMGMVYSKADLKNKIKWELDTDFDGQLGREECLKNFKAAMNV